MEEIYLVAAQGCGFELTFIFGRDRLTNVGYEVSLASTEVASGAIILIYLEKGIPLLFLSGWNEYHFTRAYML